MTLKNRLWMEGEAIALAHFPPHKLHKESRSISYQEYYQGRLFESPIPYCHRKRTKDRYDRGKEKCPGIQENEGVHTVRLRDQEQEEVACKGKGVHRRMN